MKVKKLLIITLIIVFIVSVTTIVTFAAFSYSSSEEKTMNMPEDLKNTLLEYYNNQ